LNREERRFVAFVRLLVRKRRELESTGKYGTLAEQRINNDPRLTEAFTTLDDNTKGRMVRAASLALRDFMPFRKAADRAERKAEEIAKKAVELQRCLEQFFSSVPPQVVTQMFSVNNLLRTAANPRSEGRWELNREHVLDPIIPEGAIGWSWAPGIDILIGELAEKARAFRFDELPIEPAFIAVRQARNNPKTIYLRAFISYLDDLGIASHQACDVSLRKAVATVATIALDQDITLDDVNKALISRQEFLRRLSR